MCAPVGAETDVGELVDHTGCLEVDVNQLGGAEVVQHRPDATAGGVHRERVHVLLQREQLVRLDLKGGQEG
eukprot:619201-Prorocentrum_minimum.AAC.3